MSVFKTFLAAGAATLALSSAALAADRYEFEANHTTVQWRANHFGFSNPAGTFMDVTGHVTLDEADPSKSSVEATIRPASVVTGIDKFNEHLKSDDFFKVSEFPEATFKSTSVTKTGDQTADVTGNLTLLGVTKPVTLKTTLNKIGENPMNQIQTAGFSATTTLKRSDFGITYAIPGVSDEVELQIEVEAQKK